MLSSGTTLPSQEQLEAMYKQLPSSSNDQLEMMQKQMLALMEQQKKMASLINVTQSSTSPGGPASITAPMASAPAEMIQMPLLLFPVPGIATPFSSFPSTSGPNSATPSPTSSTTSTDSGISQLSGISGMSLQQQQHQANITATREPLSFGGVHRRPLSESQSAPGFQSVPDSQFEVLQKQFQSHQQQLLLQSQQMQQHYLEQQQR